MGSRLAYETTDTLRDDIWTDCLLDTACWNDALLGALQAWPDDAESSESLTLRRSRNSIASPCFATPGLLGVAGVGGIVGSAVRSHRICLEEDA